MRRALLPVMLLVGLGAQGASDESYLALLLWSGGTPDAYRVLMADPRAGAVVRSFTLPDHASVPTAMFAVDGLPSSRVGMLFQERGRAPGPERLQPCSMLRIVDIAEGRVTAELAVLPYLADNLLAVPRLHRLYVSGHMLPQGCVEEVVQFGAQWRHPDRRPHAFPWRAAFSPDGQTVWTGFEGNTDAAGGMRRIDLVSQRVVQDVPFPEPNWWPGELLVAEDGSVFMAAYYDSLTNGTKRRAVMAWRPGGKTLGDLGVLRRGPMLGYWDRGGVLCLLADEPPCPLLQLCDAVTGRVTGGVPLTHWDHTPESCSGIMLDDRVLALFDAAASGQAVPLLFVDLEAQSVRALDLQGTVLVSALGTELSTQDVTEVKALAAVSGPQPIAFVPLVLPRPDQARQLGPAWTNAELSLIERRLRQFILPPWLPPRPADHALRMDGWAPTGEVAYLRYSVCSQDEIPSWRLDFEWLLNLAVGGDPALRGRFSGSGRWTTALLVGASEAQNEAALVHSAVRHVLAPRCQASERHVLSTEAGLGVLAIDECGVVSDRGKHYRCFRAILGDWWAYIWVEPGKPPIINYQLAPCAASEGNGTPR